MPALCVLRTCFIVCNVLWHLHTSTRITTDFIVHKELLGFSKYFNNYKSHYSFSSGTGGAKGSKDQPGFCLPEIWSIDGCALLFLFRAKYFKGKKIHGEIDIKVEQVSSGRWTWGSTVQTANWVVFFVWCEWIPDFFSFPGWILWSQPRGSCQWWILCGHGSSSEWGEGCAVSVKRLPWCYGGSIRAPLELRESPHLPSHPSVSKNLGTLQ